MRRSIPRLLMSLVSMLLALHLSAAPAASQVLNLGDPAPPALGEAATCRAMARGLRTEAQALRAATAEGSTAEHAVLIEAQAAWRDLAALLLERPDPLAECERVLLGWTLVESAVDLDAAIAAVAETSALDAEGREDCLWTLRRFSAAAPPAAGALLEAQAAAALLCEALTPLGPGAPPSIEEVEALRARVEGDVDLSRAADWLRRVEESMRPRSALSPRTRRAFDRLANAVDDLAVLDETPWLSPAWQPNRARVAGACLDEVLSMEAGETAQLKAIDSIAGAAQRLAKHAQRPPTDRLRLTEYLATAQEWSRLALVEGQSPPWRLLFEALDSAAKRREEARESTHRDIRLACKAIDDQSDQLERLMGEALRRLTAEEAGSDPAWATLIGGHRLNRVQRRRLVDLPGAIDAIERLDRRAAANIWPRLAPLARSAGEARQREQLAAQAREITEFALTQLMFEGEEAWGDASSAAAALFGEQREAILRRLDSLRRVRAGELAEGAVESKAAADLAALGDLFRLVVVWQRLEAAAKGEGDAGLSSAATLPAALPAQRAAALRDDLRRAGALAPAGGVQFQRAVERARLMGADAVILSHVLEGEGASRAAAPPPYLQALERITLGELSRERPGESKHRLAQWCVLQFESTGPGGSPAVSLYREFLAQRLAEALWRRVD